MVVAAGGAGLAGEGPRGREAPRGAAGLVNAADTNTCALETKRMTEGGRKVCVAEYGRFLCYFTNKEQKKDPPGGGGRR